MAFTSPAFLFIFLPLFLSVYFLSPRAIEFKNFVALCGSLLFFSWGEPLFVFALVALTYLDFRISQIISPEYSITPKRKKYFLFLGVFLNVSALVASKYSHFLISEVLSRFGNWTTLQQESSKIPLILGISFITFHKISFLVDRYRGNSAPPKNFLNCLLYIFLFPQLIAGPIIRYQDIGDQIQNRVHSSDGFISGFLRFSFGLSKKLLFADPMGALADRVFSLPNSDLSSVYAWGGIIGYTLQIYFDFSAYSDMAIGLARIIGFKFPENFNRPYISMSITEFWQRWHISLSTWMRIYLYFPLGGNRRSPMRTYFNLWIVFLFSGIWHGASWNFIVWGAYYGFFLSLERFLASHFKENFLPPLLRQLLTLFIVMIGWVFFRAPSLSSAMSYLSTLFSGVSLMTSTSQPWGIIFSSRDLVTMGVGIVLSTASVPLAFVTQLPLKEIVPMFNKDWLLFGKFVLCVFLLLLGSSAIVSSGYVPFLYFRF